MAVRIWGLLWLAAAALVNSGCAMYSEARDKQGQALTAAWEKVNLQTPVETSRKNFAVLLEEQMKFEDELWAHSRGVLAEQMLVSWSGKEFKDRLDRAIKAVVGVSAGPEVSALPNARRNIEQANEKIEEEERGLANSSVTWPGCDATASPKREEVLAERANSGLTADQLKTLKTALTSEAIKGYCVTATSPLPRAPGGELLRAQQALTKVESAIGGAKKDVEVKVNELKAAAKELADAQAALEPGKSGSIAVTDAKDRLNNAKDRFKIALAAVTNLQSAVGLSFLAQEELDTVNEFLTNYENVTAGKGAAEGSNRLAIALALFPDINDKAQKALKDLKKPNLVPLVQHKQLAQTKLAAAERDVQRQQTLLQLHQTWVDQLMARLEYLNRALAATDKVGLSDNEKLRYALVPAKQSPLDLPKLEDQKKADADLNPKRELWRVAALFLYAEGNLRADIGKTRQRILAANYEKSIDYAEAGLAQWNALLGPSVELMAEYGKSGTRIKDIQDALNTVALWLIAVETGK